MDYLLSATYSNASRTGGTSVTVSGNDADLKAFDQVNDLNFAFIGGLGAKLNAGKGNFFFAELRYDKGLFLYNVPEERYSNPSIVNDLSFVEDDVFLNFLSLNVGYVWSIFKPVKLEQR